MRAMTHALGLAVGFAVGLAAPAALAVECDPRGRPAPGNPDWQQVLMDEMALSVPERMDFQVGGQAVFLHASTVTRAQEDLLRDIIENIAAELDALSTELGAREARPVHVMASLREDIFPRAGAFAICYEYDEPFIYYADGLVVPGNSCHVVVFPERLEADGAETAAFVVAHEWMHTLQLGEGAGQQALTRWWREGSAQWFAHKVVDGYEQEEYRIRQFYSQQPHCTLQQLSYANQVFFFWGEQAFDARWVLELTRGDGAHLSSVPAIAGIMAPEHWRAWSIAMTDATIRYPDGRPLPTPPEPDTLRLRPQCPLRVQGPPLSVQMRRIELAGGAGGDRIHFDTGGAIVSLRWPDGRWQHLKETRETVDPGAWDHFTVAAISASEHPVNLRIGAGGLGDECACHIGEWMEVEHEGGARIFRAEPEGNPGLAMAGYEMQITYVNEGPILTLNPDQTYTLDDAFQQRYSAQGETFWQLSLDRNRDTGRWRIDEDRRSLILARTSTSERGSLNAAGVVSPWTSHTDLPGREVGHEFHCEGDRLEVSWVGRAEARRRGVEQAPPVAVFRRVAAGGSSEP